MYVLSVRIFLGKDGQLRCAQTSDAKTNNGYVLGTAQQLPYIWPFETDRKVRWLDFNEILTNVKNLSLGTDIHIPIYLMALKYERIHFPLIIL